MMKTRVIKSSPTNRTASDRNNKHVSLYKQSEDSSAQERKQRLIALLDEAIALTDITRIDCTSSSK